MTSWRVPADVKGEYEIRMVEPLLAPGQAALGGRGDLPGRRLVLIDDNAARHWEAPLRECLASIGVEAEIMRIPGGEAAKSLAVTETVLRRFEDFGLNRRTEPVLIVGGGAVLDVGGFAASIYRRGVPYIRVPTTLLAYVDAAIGVKTGVNFHGRKNLVGSFARPALVLLERAFLTTVAPREIVSGLGELLKLGVGCDAEIFAMLETLGPAPSLTDEATLELLRRAIDTTLRELNGNLYEAELCRALDLGHTFSQAFEMRHGVRHGEAVAWDVNLSTIIAERRGLLDAASAARVAELTARLGTPSRIPGIDPGELWSSLRERAQHRAGHQRVPLPSSIGRCTFVNDLTEAEVAAALARLRGGGGRPFGIRRDVTMDQQEDHSAKLARLLSQTNSDPQDRLLVEQRAAAYFTWDYARTRPNLADLYRRGLRLQWSADDLPWETPVDQEKLITEEIRATPDAYRGADLDDTVFAKWGEKEWVAASIELQNWTISQFLHGEQGALVCTAKLVETVPWVEAKFYAAAQVLDEARHVDVFSRYIDEKLSETYPVNTHLAAILTDIVSDRRWDMVYLGMQTLVEGLALAAFNLLRESTKEPLLKGMLERIITDEARHVAFGVMSLREFYQGLSAAEIKERQEFAFESVLHLRDRFLQQEAWERIGAPRKDVVALMLNSPERDLFNKLLFSKIVPQCRAIGLLDAGDGWLRTKFDELGLSELETLDDGTGGADRAFATTDATT